jgi:hypothetical protein
MSDSQFRSATQVALHTRCCLVSQIAGRVLICPEHFLTHDARDAPSYSVLLWSYPTSVSKIASSQQQVQPRHPPIHLTTEDKVVTGGTPSVGPKESRNPGARILGGQSQPAFNLVLSLAPEWLH